MMKSEADFIRERLTAILNLTQSEATASYWGGDRAAERRVSDNFTAGRLSFKSAHGSASHGLESLNEGNVDLAREHKSNAERMLLDALVRQMTPEQWADLRGDAGLRGRRNATSDRNILLARAVAEQEKKGLTGKAARNAALNENPSIASQFFGAPDDTIRSALNRGRRNL